MENGNLSIGTTSHVANSNLWNGEIYKMSIYANDISKIPLFDLSRNGFILDDCSQNKYSSFFKINLKRKELNVNSKIKYLLLIREIINLKMKNLNVYSLIKYLLLSGKKI